MDAANDGERKLMEMMTETRSVHPSSLLAHAGRFYDDDVALREASAADALALPRKLTRHPRGYLHLLHNGRLRFDPTGGLGYLIT